MVNCCSFCIQSQSFKRLLSSFSPLASILHSKIHSQLVVAEIEALPLEMLHNLAKIHLVGWGLEALSSKFFSAWITSFLGHIKRQTWLHMPSILFTYTFSMHPRISIRGFVRPSNRPFIHPSVRLSICPSVHLSVRPCVHKHQGKTAKNWPKITEKHFM